MDGLFFIIITAVVTAVLTGMTRISGQLGQGTVPQTRGWQLSATLMKAGRWMTLTGAVLIVPFVVISWPLEALYPAISLPTLGTVMAAMTVLGGFVLAFAALLVTGVLIWRVLLRFGFRPLIWRFKQAVQTQITVQNSRKTLKFFGQLCFTVCVVLLQFIGGAFLLMIKGALEGDYEAEERSGFYYNSTTGKMDNGLDPFGIYYFDRED